MNLFLQKFKQAQAGYEATPEEVAKETTEAKKEVNKNYVQFKQGVIDKGMAQQQGMGVQPPQGAM